MIHPFLRGLEFLADQIVRVFRRLFGSRLPICVVAYDGFATDRRAILRGRVLRERPFPLATATDSSWRNFRRIWAMFLSHEVAGASLRFVHHAQTVETISDKEGYYYAEFDLASDSLPDSAWHDYQIECLDPPTSETFVGQFQTPGPRAEFGVVSDIDDTVLETGATRLWFMVKTTIFGNVHTRAIFPGTAQFFAALTAGTTGTSANPFFYVTSSPWNLHDFVTQLFALRGIPRAPIFMADWGIDQSKLFKTSHGTHKLTAIREILARYPQLPFLLVGDSGERDPEIYSQILEEFPDRIRAIYIRDVTPTNRDEAVRRLRELAANCHRVDLVVCEDTLAAAHHAAAAGFIRPDAIASIARNCTE